MILTLRSGTWLVENQENEEPPAALSLTKQVKYTLSFPAMSIMANCIGIDTLQATIVMMDHIGVKKKV